MKTRKRMEFKANFGHMFVHIFTCTGMKLVKLAPVAALLIILNCSCENKPATSWETYCKAYNVDSNNPSESEENFYLDRWVGSVEEEQMMGK